MLWYTLEVPQGGTSNEYPQHMFLWRNYKKYQNFSVEKKASYLELRHGSNNQQQFMEKGLYCM